ncbi:MAG: aminoacyl-tRNA hydrolase [Bacteroidota bacterium]
MSCSWGFFMEKFLIVGLGNIGLEYAGTRHNIGFDIVDALATRHNAHFVVDRLAERLEITVKGKKMVCIKPTTYMNLSGKAVKYWMDKEKVEVDHVLVLVDELAVPLNKIKMKPAGSDGGHNGLRSIQEVLGTTTYPRLRFGIGNDFPRGRQVEYVLGKWRPGEKEIVARKVDRSAQAIEEFVLMGLEKTMAEVNAIEF